MSTTDDSAPPTANEAESHGRRKFLTKSAVLLTALGVSAGAAGRAAAAAPVWGPAGSTTVTPAASSSEGQALNDVLTEAASTKNIQAALQAHGQGLSAQAQSILSKLTPTDLEEISSLQTKLAGLRGSVAADNNGTIGM